MECFSGLGVAAAATGVAGTFNYNRENFKDDRAQRRRASAKTMLWRVDQAKLWRQDVRDLISLTEYKMHMYLIVNVLVLGFTIFLWTEGRLPVGTPHWLMVGNIVSISTAFMFLLLSIWLAMHAAISAQSFEARLLTQMVRLPIPTWEEFEATRTYGSEFEKTEGRQMFRVPWLMGWQENLVGGHPQSVELGIGGPSPPDPHRATPVRRVAAYGAAEGTSTMTPHSVDPWGLEQAGEGLPELGCGLGSEVAKLRHVKLSRQAALQWQSFDAFSRISMSIGVQQLLQAMSYYILGYLLVQVGSKTASVYGVIGFTMMALTIVKQDMSVSPAHLRLVQLLLVLSPACATSAALLWANFATAVAEVIVPLAFISHGLYFALIAALCHISIADRGPVAFRSVLYLDVFSWTQDHADEHVAARPVSNVPVTGALAGKPALQAVKYVDGRPVALRSNDFAPPCVKQDLRDACGAPDVSRRTVAWEGREDEEEFYNPASFLPLEHKAHEENKLGPGELPWRVFCAAMLLVCVLWFGAAVYCVHGAKTQWSLDLPTKEIRRRPTPARPGFIKPAASESELDGLAQHSRDPDDSKGMQWERWAKEQLGADGTDAGIQTTSGAQQPVSFLGTNTARHASAAAVPEQVMLSWPWPNLSPTRLTCDATGSHFVMADRVSMLSATLDGSAVASASEVEHAPTPRAVMAELDCPAVAGEGLEDVAISCNSSGMLAGARCRVLALHRHGRRLAACPLSTPKAPSILSSDQGNVQGISESWLENFHSKRAAEGGKARSKMEKALSLSISPYCKGESSAELCAVLGTTHGRVVQLTRHSKNNELIPTEVLYEGRRHDRGTHSAGVVRAFNHRFSGVLEPKDGSIAILDLSRGGLTAGTLFVALSKPVVSFCAGGGYVYMLTGGAEPEMWRIRAPRELRPEKMMAESMDKQSLVELNG